LFSPSQTNDLVIPGCPLLKFIIILVGILASWAGEKNDSSDNYFEVWESRPLKTFSQGSATIQAVAFFHEREQRPVFKAI